MPLVLVLDFETSPGSDQASALRRVAYWVGRQRYENEDEDEFEDDLVATTPR